MGFFIIKIFWAIGLLGAAYGIVAALKRKPKKSDKKDDWEEF